MNKRSSRDSGASTVRIYGADGTLIGTMDPVSRKRVATNTSPPSPELTTSEQIQALHDARTALEREIDDLKLLHAFKQTVSDLDPTVDRSSDQFRAGVIFLTILVHTGVLEEIIAFTGFQAELVTECCAHWRADGICDDAHAVIPAIHDPIAADEAAERAASEEGHAVITFWLCVLVALGHVRYDPTTDMWRSSSVQADPSPGGLGIPAS